MKKLACEMCGSPNIVKKDGLWVCQSCGAKYSPEEAKKMMVEGTVKIDDSSQIEKFQKLANKYFLDENYDKMLEYIDKLKELDPDNFEAYKIIGQLNYMLTYTYDKYIPEWYVRFSWTDGTSDINIDDIVSIFTNDSSRYLKNFIGEYILSILNIQSKFRVNKLEKWCKNGDQVVAGQLEDNIKVLDKLAMIDFENKSINKCINVEKQEDNKLIQICTENFNDNSITHWKTMNEETKNGCYIATFVYESYDCPEVWTLRRFRDNNLDNTFQGKLFIKIYYVTSPTLVKWFGNKKWFKNLFKNRLDKLVEKLQKEGIESTYYIDK